MTFKTNKLRNAIIVAIAGSSALAVTGAAFAQDKSEKKEDLDTIVVTGSRIKRADSESSQPVFTLQREAIEAQGLTSVGDVIQNITTNGSTLNTTFNNGGNGETRVSLRNLGSNRTLVLVNGHRWVGGTGLGGAVDLNTIPTAAIERIDVLKDGASTIYGSDAIAGVVNVILRRNFNGAEASTYLGSYTRGDGTRQSYDVTIGSSSDRWSALLGLAYVKEDKVMAGDRAISSMVTDGAPGVGESSTIPGGRFALCVAPATFNPLTGTCSAAERRPDGTSGQFTYDPGKSGTAWRARTAADLYNFAPDNYLLTPQERKSLFASGSLNISDNLRFNVDVTYNQRKSEQLLAAMPIVLGSGPGAGVQTRQVTISPNSIYNPFGQTVSRIQRRAVETGGRSFNQDDTTFATNLALEGSFDIGSKTFDWEAGYFNGDNKSNNTTNGLFNVLALRNALGPSMIVGGKPICVSTAGNAATVIAGCVPLNLLGAPGSITPDMLAYSTFVAHDQFGYEQKMYYANVGGALFDLPGGPFAFSFGLEHRSEFGFDSPDALINSGNTTGNSRTATRGGYTVNEAYLELAVPVLADVTGAQLLDFSLATRYSDYSNFGNTTNSKIGFRWKPIKDLMIRGNWTEGFRAPSINELFQGVSDSFQTTADPCSNTFGGFYTTLDATQQARCTAQGVPVGGYDQGNSQIRSSVGGNVNLKPETSVSETLGFVYSPSWLEGFDISLDWWKIKLEQAISSDSPQTILERCILDGNPAYCSLYTRAAGGGISQLNAFNHNIGRILVSGYDMTANYRFPETAFGKFNVSWDATYMTTYREDFDGDGTYDSREVGNYTQSNNNWRIRSNVAIGWNKGDWGANWNIRYYDDQDEKCSVLVANGFGNLCSNPVRLDSNGNPSLAPENHIAATVYNDASVYWNAPWNAKITLGLNNVFGRNPPHAYTAFANSFDPQYEVPGRFVYFRYKQTF